MLWCALLFPWSPTEADAPGVAVLEHATHWALAITPRVTRQDEAVLMEVQACLRLWGGQQALQERVAQQAPLLGAHALAWAPNALAALALARAGRVDGLSAPLVSLLDGLPLHTLSALRPHADTLAQMGCRCLGDVRALPRGGLGRRFEAGLLQALDQAYGQRPQAHAWAKPAERFEARLELPWRVEHSTGLMDGARHLLWQLSAWLAARQEGVTAITLHWAHDAMRGREVGEGGELSIRTAEPTRQTEHLARLLAEHLAHVTLDAPVGELRLCATDTRPLSGASASLLLDERQPAEPLPQLLERLSARLGPERVLRPQPRADHRPEAMCEWLPATGPAPRGDWPDAGPQPAFLLPAPLKLVVREHRPQYLGELQLLLGPQRVEGGWWDRDDAQGAHRHVARDYWLAWSAQAGLLWVFQTRPQAGDASPAWFLHGLFA